MEVLYKPRENTEDRETTLRVEQTRNRRTKVNQQIDISERRVTRRNSNNKT